jgi:hypothetical protein
MGIGWLSVRFARSKPTDAPVTETLAHSFPLPLSVPLTGSWEKRPSPVVARRRGWATPVAVSLSHPDGSELTLWRRSASDGTAASLSPHLPFILHLPLELMALYREARAPRWRCGTEKDGGGWSALCPRRGLPFGRGGGVLLHCHVLRPVPWHADAHRVERNDAATVVALFDGGPVSFFSPSVTFELGFLGY